MICGVVATSISGCGVCIVYRVVYNSCSLHAHYTAHSTHTTAWNTCCHNTSNHIKIYFLLINSTIL